MNDSPDEYEYSDDGQDAQVQLAWQDSLDWARNGDSRDMATLLRNASIPLESPEVRTFLADVLEKKVKFPRGRQTRRPERTWGFDANGKIAMIDARHEQTLKIRNWVRDHRTSLGDRVYAEAATHFNVVIETIENADRRSAKAWNKVRSS